MIENADKLGMDLGDLQEYGFDVKSMKCGGMTCINKDKFKTYEDILEKGTKFGLKLGDEGAKLYRRVSQCHPAIKNHVTPRVEGIFTMFPCNLCCCFLPCGLPLDICCWLIPCVNCCCAIPFDVCIVTPWNTLWVAFLALIVVGVAGL